MKLTLYSRYGCHLCEDMIEQLNELMPDHAFELDVIDIDDDPDLVSRFNDLVPVLMREEHEICRYFLDQKTLLDTLDKND